MTQERVTVEVAATRLGCSVRTVRRRIHAGDLLAEREQLAQGFRWWVLLEAPTPEPASHDQDTASPGAEAAAVLLEQVISERDWLRGQVEELTRQAGNYQVLLLQAQEKIRLLEGGQPAGQDMDSKAAAASQPGRQPDRPPAPPRNTWAARIIRKVRGR